MKKLFTLWMIALLPCWLYAQQDAEAEKVLDQTFSYLMEDNGGIRADFTGTETGFLLLKGKKFYLNNSRVQCWYDGKTLWSYLPETEEVNISEPTLEELQGILPYFLLKEYKKNYHYSYQGKRGMKNKKTHEIVLTKKHPDQRESITMLISEMYHPEYIRIEQNGRTVFDIQLTSFKTKQHLEDSMFHFNQSLYPNVEVIDMR